MKKGKRYITLALGLLIVGSCVKRTDFEQNKEGILEVDLQWKEGDTAVPMSFAFYKSEDGKLYEEFDGTSEGFKGILPEGDYKMIAYDRRASRVGFRNMDLYDAAEVYALPQTAKTRIEDENLLQEPGSMPAIGTCVETSVLSVKRNTTVRAKAIPQNLARAVVLHFEIKNGDNVSRVSGVVSGISPSVNLATGKTSAKSAKVPFSVQRLESNSFETNIKIFDFILVDNQSKVNEIAILLEETSGARHNIQLDLTQVIKEIINGNEGVIPIEIPIEIKVDMVDLLNIKATVQPWVQGSGGGDIIK